MSVLTPASEARPPDPSLRPSYFTNSGRDLRLDILRGYYVFAMIVDHLAGFSLLHFLSGSNRFFTSAAEGFILVSGITAGFVYRRLIGRSGFAAAARKGLNRAFDLYLLAVSLALLVLFTIKVYHLPGAQELDWGRQLRFLINVFTLRQTSTFADVMLLYALLLVLMPLALALLVRGHTVILLAGSGLAWLVYQLWPEQVVFPWAIAGDNYFPFAAWQMLFYGGLAVGYHRDRVSSYVAQRRRTVHLVAGFATAALVALFVVLSLSPDQHAWGPLSSAGQAWIREQLFARTQVAPGRILATVVVFTFFHLSLTRWWRVLQRPLTVLLLPLGQNALYAFTLHVIICLITWVVGTEYGFWLNAVFELVVLGVIWWLARRRFLIPTPRTRLYWRAVPFGIAWLLLIVLLYSAFFATPL